MHDTAENEELRFDKNVELNIPGWSALKIEYAFKVNSNVSWVFWRIQGTEHVFQIQYQTILLKHAGDIKEHFSLTLETFRKDFKDWQREGFPEEWMKRYQQMFSSMIK